MGGEDEGDRKEVVGVDTQLCDNNICKVLRLMYRVSVFLCGS